MVSALDPLFTSAPSLFHLALTTENTVLDMVLASITLASANLTTLLELNTMDLLATFRSTHLLCLARILLESSIVLIVWLKEQVVDFNVLGAQTPLTHSDNSHLEFALKITSVETAPSMLAPLLLSLFLQSAQITVLDTDIASTFPLVEQFKPKNKEP